MTSFRVRKIFSASVREVSLTGSVWIGPLLPMETILDILSGLFLCCDCVEDEVFFFFYACANSLFWRNRKNRKYARNVISHDTQPGQWLTRPLNSKHTINIDGKITHRMQRALTSKPQSSVKYLRSTKHEPNLPRKDFPKISNRHSRISNNLGLRNNYYGHHDFIGIMDDASYTYSTRHDF